MQCLTHKKILAPEILIFFHLWNTVICLPESCRKYILRITTVQNTRKVLEFLESLRHCIVQEIKNKQKGQRLESDIYKLKNEKSAKNGEKRGCSTGTPANPRRLRYEKKNFKRTRRSVSGLTAWKFRLRTVMLRLRKSCLKLKKTVKTYFYADFFNLSGQLRWMRMQTTMTNFCVKKNFKNLFQNFRQNAPKSKFSISS